MSKLLKARVFFLLLLFLVTGCARKSCRFIVTGDSRGSDNGVNTAILSEIAKEIVAQKADFVLVTGDLVNGCTDSNSMKHQFKTWCKTMRPVYRAGIEVYVVRGNHDISKTEELASWNKFFKSLPDNGTPSEKKLTYSVKRKNALIIALDQYVEPHRVNQKWLDEQLSSNQLAHIFVFGHEPAFGAMHKDCLDAFPAQRDIFWKSLASAGCRVYFCGHDHFYNHASIDDDCNSDNDVHQYIVGTAGAPLRDWQLSYNGNNSSYTVQNIKHARQYGYVLVELYGPEAVITWMQRTNDGLYEPAETWSYVSQLYYKE